MFAPRYFPLGYYPARYFPPGVAEVTATADSLVVTVALPSAIVPQLGGMFAPRYFPVRYFSPRYFPPGAAEVTATADSLVVTVTLPSPSIDGIFAVADSFLVHAYVLNPVAIPSAAPQPETVPARHFGGEFRIHPNDQEYVDQRSLVESFGFTILEERQFSGHTTLLVEGPHTALKTLLQNPEISTIRVQMDFVIWPLRIGDPLTAATVAEGSTRAGTQAFH